MKKSAMAAMAALTACTIDLATEDLVVEVEFPDEVIEILEGQDEVPPGIDAAQRIIGVIGTHPENCEALMDQTREALTTLFPKEEGLSLIFTNDHYLKLTLNFFEEQVLVTAELFDAEDERVLDISTTCNPE